VAIQELISKEQIEEKVVELGKQISKDYVGKSLVIVGVLKGSFLFLADLVRHINIPVEIEFLKASSYGSNTVSSGNVKIELDLNKSIEGKHVLLVEDIVDTGLTIKKITEMFQTRGPKSVKLASFLYKKERVEHKVQIDYLAFEIKDHFVIGYGLDLDEKYRELPYVGIYHED